MSITQRIAPCLWFNDQAEQAASFYVSVFKNSRIVRVSRYSEAGREIHGRLPGSVMVVSFELDVFKFTEAISLQVNCDTQKEIDYYWEALSHGSDPAAQQCGWLKDRYGLSWQVVPTMLQELMKDHTTETARRATEAILRMKKIDISELERAVSAGTQS
jgi:predicted 3-demethylubiquinone-9 3-methyltransferase (glyoxalase superfamily)